ncbi:Ankyrin repeat-containing protein [Sulfurivirga caldicuralii]|uniref:Ankyrin repeat-containing protein n=1 Tax=Sulfurivirga caldicuralii TaxID=364032 RepID=A0A1N6F2V2_9GAMM|nr:ankyrin repeat domain-containing protein [Sulfurivirga caldicuralii]SIN89536.1 Ankyrin repeat-containing protein [Sulfurivirga caldicuralii]
MRRLFWTGLLIMVLLGAARAETPAGKALLQACQQQGLSALQQADRSLLDADDQYALWALAAKRNWPFDAVRKLLPVDVVGPYGRTIAWPAAEYGRLGWLKALEPKLLSVQDDQDQTPLMQAAWSGQLEAVKWLAAHGGRLDAHNRTGWTSLHMALFNDQLDVVDWLLAQQVPVTGETRRGWTTVSLAVAGGHCQLLPRLLKAGADKNTPVQIGGQTFRPDELAKSLGMRDCLKWLQ